MASRTIAPPPDLRIVPTNLLHAHEDHDSQRSIPLVERLRHETMMINPPLVAPMGSGQFVVLDGANRVHAFQELKYPHILVQIAPYESGQVELSTWDHIVSGWTSTALLDEISSLAEVQVTSAQSENTVARILLREGEHIGLCCAVQNTHDRNAAQRKIVSVYQQRARLDRTADIEPEQAWDLYPAGVAMVTFPLYLPEDIIEAARDHAFLPAGVSRHIVHGRAIQVNFPLEILRSADMSLEDKNEALHLWIQDKLANRHVRYYAEATYQYDE